MVFSNSIIFCEEMENTPDLWILTKQHSMLTLTLRSSLTQRSFSPLVLRRIPRIFSALSLLHEAPERIREILHQFRIFSQRVRPALHSALHSYACCTSGLFINPSQPPCGASDRLSGRSSLPPSRCGASSVACCGDSVDALPPMKERKELARF